MKRPSFTTVLSVLFLAFMGNNFYQIYKMFSPSLCSEDDPDAMCLAPYLEKDNEGMFPLVQLQVYLSPSSDTLGLLVARVENYQIADSFKREISVKIPKSSTQKRGTLYAHVFFTPHGFSGPNPMNAKWYAHDATQMIVFQEPEAATYQLLSDQPESKEPVKQKVSTDVAPHFRSVLPIRVATDNSRFAIQTIPQELRQLLTEVPNTAGSARQYAPIMSIDEMSLRSKDLVEIIPGNETMKLSIVGDPISVSKLIFLTVTAKSTYQLVKQGFSDHDIDQIRGLFADTSLALIMVTFMVSTLHLLFDMLAFKNDISFWKGRSSMVGLSSKTLLWSVFSHTIIFFYLWDQKTSLLVLIPSGISTLIEYWKLTVAYKVTFSFREGVKIGGHSKEENLTESFDAEGMKYLSYLLVPVLLLGSAYSLIYVPHKSWSSWLIQTAVNGVYGFGFLFMLPQLFVNYKLKSVAHLPWKAFMYKAFNTFIDDLFAFIITMPTAHRMACFRDDVVFVVYLYQRWLYPVDYSRPNEYNEAVEKKEESKKNI